MSKKTSTPANGDTPPGPNPEGATPDSPRDLRVRLRYLRLNVEETGVRIRRYTLDPRLRRTGCVPDSKATPPPAPDANPPRPEPSLDLRREVDELWKKWIALRETAQALSAASPRGELDRVEKTWLELDRQLDLIQRELISDSTTRSGLVTVAWMAAALVLLGLFYLVSHGVRGFDFSKFEAWPEWGPLKYGEVAFWSAFGVLCWLLFLASSYLKRRDFDSYYTTWYISTALRAPFLVVMLMIVVLEFTEYTFAGTPAADSLFEEGNKYYFIILVSFCLGLSSDSTSTIARQLAESVSGFVRRAVGRFCRRLDALVVDARLPAEPSARTNRKGAGANLGSPTLDPTKSGP
jgi:hypothetical protein